MNPRPRKQRKLTIHSSDSEPELDDQQPPEQTAPAASTKNRKLNKPGPASNLVSSRAKTKASTSTAPSQSQSRKTTPSPGKRPQKQTNGTGSSPAGNLHSFFTRATDEQRWSKTKFESTSHSHSPHKLDAVPEDIIDSDGGGDLDDVIEDDYDSYDEIFAHFSGPTKSGSNSGAGRGLGRDEKTGGTTNSTASRKGPSKPFLMPQSKPPITLSRPEEDTRPWAQRFAPRSLDELAVHKKKVADVRAWLEGVYSGRNPCVCLLDTRYAWIC